MTQPAASATRAPHFAVVDVETTGLSAESHRVIEVAVVTTDPWGRVLDEWSTRLNPEGRVGATHIHGITDADVAHSPRFTDVVGMLNQRLTGAAVVAHQARFDLAFLRAEYRRAGWVLPHLPALCTLQASEHHLPGLDRRRLPDCCWAVGAPLEGAHSALGDARATAGLLAAFMHLKFGLPPLAEHVRMPSEALTVVWPTGPTLSLAERVLGTSGPASRSMSGRALNEIGRKTAAGRQSALVELIERFPLVDALDEGAPAGAVPYLEKLAEVLEDGEVTAEEAADLQSVAETEQLATADVDSAHEAFVPTLAHAALEDAKVTRSEKAELQTVAALLGVNDKLIPRLLDRADVARDSRLSAGLQELPTNWEHGEPLRVGDKVVFTGCEDHNRNQLEDESARLGVRILATVSPKVSILVADGTMVGTKASRAAELGTRTMHPETYRILLQHLQPALPREVRAAPKSRPTTKHRHAASGDPAADGAQAVHMSASPGPDPVLVCAWPGAAGMEVGVRGRVSKELIAAYSAAHLETS